MGHRKLSQIVHLPWLALATALLGLMLTACNNACYKDTHETQEQKEACKVYRIEVRELIDDEEQSEITSEYIADVFVEDCARIRVEPRSAGEALKRLKKAVEEIQQQKLLKVRSSEQRQINGESVNVSVKVEVTTGDPRYPWAVHDQLAIKYGFDVEMDAEE